MLIETLVIVWSILGIVLMIKVSNIPGHMSLWKRWYYFLMAGPVVWLIGLGAMLVM